MWSVSCSMDFLGLVVKFKAYCLSKRSNLYYNHCPINVMIKFFMPFVV